VAVLPFSRPGFWPFMLLRPGDNYHGCLMTFVTGEVESATRTLRHIIEVCALLTHSCGAKGIKMRSLGHVESWDIAQPVVPMNEIRLIIIEEHLAVRRALAARLESYSHIDVVATAGNFQSGLEQAQQLRPDVIVLELRGRDQQHPDPIGEMSRALGSHPPGIIVLTSFVDDNERETALQAGARRYLLKQINTAQLLAEIEKVAEEAAVGAN
jgi:CheY-like chemotaxis protein